jgi:ATP-dependent Clp protease adaptor protein ClpS
MEDTVFGGRAHQYPADVTTAMPRTALQRPAMWTCKFLNDDFTPMVFVIRILMEIFNQSRETAEAITRKIHETGMALVGSYPKDIAHLKCYQTVAIAQKQQYPLQVIPEEI